MIELEGVTAMAVKLALDAAVLRHHVIANNLANVQTPGFAPARLDFEELLRAAQVGFSDIGDDDALRARLEQVERQLARPGALRRGSEGPVEIDVEMIQLADNTIRYQALLQGIAKQTAILRLAIQGGRS